jgi:alpha-1,6-mannosyltransferase
VALGVFLVLDLLAGVGFGWTSALSTPGQVRSWLSATTALGMLTGNLLYVLHLGYHVDGAVNGFRDVGTLLTLVVIAWLVLTGHRRSPARGLGLSLLALVMLGPVVQPWYLLWPLVILAGAGLSRGETRAAVLISTGFVVDSVATSGSTVPTYAYVSSGIAALIAIGVVVGLLAVSRRSRGVLLDDSPSETREPELAAASG